MGEGQMEVKEMEPIVMSKVTLQHKQTMTSVRAAGQHSHTTIVIKKTAGAWESAGGVGGSLIITRYGTGGALTTGLTEQ